MNRDPKGIPTGGRFAEGKKSESEVGLGQTMQTSAPLSRIPVDMAAREAYGIVTGIRDGEIIVDAPYQRQSVWDDTQRRNLIRSHLEGTPIPALIINTRSAHGRNGEWDGDYRDSVVDGRQRVETMVKWFDSELTVPASWFPADQVADSEQTDDGPYVCFNHLTKTGQLYFKRAAVFPVAESRLPSLRDEAELYLRLNSAGTAQTDEDLDNARQVMG